MWNMRSIRSSTAITCLLYIFLPSGVAGGTPVTKSFSGAVDAVGAAVNTFTHAITENRPTTSKIATSIGISNNEIGVAKARLTKVHDALNKLMKKDIDPRDMPVIGICFSGGGYRAMFATIGWLRGASNKGILGATTYVSALSGSTWAIAPWISSGLSLSNFYKRVKERKNQSIFDMSGLNFSVDAAYLGVKSYYRQPMSIVDLYGMLLASKLLSNLESDAKIKMNQKNDPQSFTLSAQAKILATGLRPYPIYTGCLPVVPEGATKEVYRWVEFTPHEVNIPEWPCSMPTWAFGRSFANGKSSKFEPEQLLGFLMGIWGSAFAVSARDAFRHTKPDIPAPLRPLISSLLKVSGKDDERVAAQVNNFAKDLEFDGFAFDSKNLEIVDAGIDFNLPLPPLLRKSRGLDLIIICDASKDIKKGSPDLAKAIKWAGKRGYALPSVDPSAASKQLISVFDSDSNDMPSLVYMPLMNNPSYPNTDEPFDIEAAIQSGFAHTKNFDYKPNEIKALVGLTRFTMEQQAAKILLLMKRIIERKKKARLQSEALSQEVLARMQN